MTPAFIASLILIPPVYLALVYWLIVRRLPLLPRRGFIALTVVELALSSLHALTFFVELPGFWVWFLDVNAELSLGTMFSAVQLLAIALLALAVGGSLRGWQRAYWLLVVVVFLYMSVDESGLYQIHETMHPLVWRIAYAAAGLLLLAATLALYWFVFRQERLTFALLVIGLGVLGASGVFVEQVVIHYLRNHRFFLFEEFFEMAGASIFLTGMLLFAREHLPERGKRVGRVLVGVGSAVWCLWMAGNGWLFPAFELRLLATPVQVDYLDGAMTLVGYTVSRDVIHPGDQVTVNLYWRANDYLSDDYFWSVRAVTRPDIATIAYTDFAQWGIYPTSAWIPDIPVRKSVSLDIPSDAPTPKSYWLLAGVWRDQQNPEFMPISQTGQMKLDD